MTLVFVSPPPPTYLTLTPSQRTEDEEKSTHTINLRDKTDLLIRGASLGFGRIGCLFSFLNSLLAEDKTEGRSLGCFSDCRLSEKKKTN